MASFAQKARFVPPLWMTHELLLEFAVHCLLITYWFSLLNLIHQGCTEFLVICGRTSGEVYAAKLVSAPGKMMVQPKDVRCTTGSPGFQTLGTELVFSLAYSLAPRIK